MRGQYRHTQVGWVIIVSMLVAAAIVVPAFMAADLNLGLVIFLAVFGVVLLLFCTLTVSVDSDEIRLRFGIGIIRKRVPLSSVRLYREVKNRWYYGWGIRYIPGGALWNVSGLRAVELVLTSGKRLRIGTDQPEALSLAIHNVLGKPQPLTDQEREQQRRDTRRGLVVLLAIGVGLAGAVGALFYLQMRPPTVKVSQHEISVNCLFYGEAYSMRQITDISLEQRLPLILARTNGFALAGTLRGYFKVEGLGEAKLFVERAAPPYILIHTRDRFVIINFQQPERTRALYAELTEHWSGR